MAENILAEEKPKVIKLADGKDYTFPPMDLTTWANIEASLNYPLSQLQERFKTEPMQTLQSLTYALLKENYPELTKEQAGRLVTLNILPSLTDTFSHFFSQIIAVAR